MTTAERQSFKQNPKLGVDVMMHLKPGYAAINPEIFSGTVCGSQGEKTDNAALVDCPMCLHWHSLANLDSFTDAYVTCALWSSHDESNDAGGDPMDQNYSAQDIAPPTLAAMIADCAKFQTDNAADIAAAIEGSGNGSLVYSDAGAGHDFWLTRNHHGVGFWDRGLGDVGKRLTSAAHAFGEVDLYIGDDKQIWA